MTETPEERLIRLEEWRKLMDDHFAEITASIGKTLDKLGNELAGIHRRLEKGDDLISALNTCVGKLQERFDHPSLDHCLMRETVGGLDKRLRDVELRVYLIVGGLTIVSQIPNAFTMAKALGWIH